MRTARAKGMPGSGVVLRHMLRNASIPVVTVIGLQLGLLLSGAVLTETIFSLPGLGRLMVDSILSRDYPVVQAGALFIAFVFVLINLPRRSHLRHARSADPPRMSDAKPSRSLSAEPQAPGCAAGVPARFGPASVC